MRGRLCKSLLSSSKILRGLRDLQRGSYRKKGSQQKKIRLRRLRKIGKMSKLGSRQRKRKLRQIGKSKWRV